MAPTKQMNVKVRDGLAAVSAVIDHHAKAAFCKTEVGGEVMGLQRDALIEPGGKVAVILYHEPKCAADGCAVDKADYTE